MTREEFISQVGQCQEQLRRFLTLLCGGDRFRADDIAQEAVLKAYLSFGSFEGRCSFSSWLMRIGYNCFIDDCRRGARRAFSPMDVKEFEGEDSASDSSETASGVGTAIGNIAADRGSEADSRFAHEQLYVALAALSDAQRAVTVLFYMEDKSIKEISQILNMPSATVRSHLFRARAQLKRILSKEI